MVFQKVRQMFITKKFLKTDVRHFFTLCDHVLSVQELKKHNAVPMQH